MKMFTVLDKILLQEVTSNTVLHIDSMILKKCLMGLYDYMIKKFCLRIRILH